MKELKFRAYWKGLNQYKYFDNLSLTEDAYTGKFGMFLPSLDGTVFLGKTEPEMFTGFKDSKGNDIYEGDVLSDVHEEVELTRQVFWCEKTGAWTLDSTLNQDKSEGGFLSEELEDSNFEVIGTIHQETLKNTLS